MSSRDRLLGLTVAVLWGLNFLAVRAGVDHLPPFFFAGLRFLVIAVPVVLLVQRPPVLWRWIMLYGLGFGVMQFGFLFYAIHIGMPAGLASLVIQTGAPMTVLLGWMLLGERISRAHIIGLFMAVSGIALITFDRGRSGAALLPIMLTLAAALGWSIGNLATRRAGVVDPQESIRLMLWMTVIPPVPLLVFSAFIEGPTTGWSELADAFHGPGWPALVGLAYIVVFGTLAGSGLWTYLINKYPVATVSPFSLLIPVVGVAAAWIVLDETPGHLALAGSAIVLTGFAFPLLHQRLHPVVRPPESGPHPPKDATGTPTPPMNFTRPTVSTLLLARSRRRSG
jgi:O-acetylserine/cysteine efflux transporter